MKYLSLVILLFGCNMPNKNNIIDNTSNNNIDDNIFNSNNDDISNSSNNDDTLYIILESKTETKAGMYKISTTLVKKDGQNEIIDLSFECNTLYDANLIRNRGNIISKQISDYLTKIQNKIDDSIIESVKIHIEGEYLCDKLISLLASGIKINNITFGCTRSRLI